MSTRKPKNYMSNKEMLEEVIKCQQEDKISNKLGAMFHLLASRYSTKPWFAGYSYREDMIAAGVLACCVAYKKFNIEKSQNPFAFFTVIVHRAFFQVMYKELKMQNIRDELLSEANMNPSFNYSENFEDSE